MPLKICIIFAIILFLISMHVISFFAAIDHHLFCPKITLKINQYYPTFTWWRIYLNSTVRSTFVNINRQIQFLNSKFFLFRFLEISKKNKIEDDLFVLEMKLKNLLFYPTKKYLLMGKEIFISYCCFYFSFQKKIYKNDKCQKIAFNFKQVKKG